MIYTNFSIFKVKEKKSEKSPDYRISAKDSTGKFITIGGAWTKKTSTGETFLSCSLSENPYPVQNMQPQASQPLTGLSETEAQTIKTLRENEIKRQEANKEMDAVANSEFDSW